MDLPRAFEDQNTGFIELCRGHAQNQRPFYAFMKMTPAQRKDYQAVLATGKTLNILKFGTLIHAGWGHEPDADTCARVLNKCRGRVVMPPPDAAHVAHEGGEPAKPARGMHIS